MILKGSQRGGAKQLAQHLLKVQENEHVELHELRGFTANDLHGALHEAYAVSRGTRAKQFLFSLSLNPPSREDVSIAEFEDAIDQVEQKLGLAGQPRAIVFHEKDGRRHAHVVWSRIDPSQMKAINLPHYKLKLRDVSRELYLEHGWQMPRGLANSKERDPRNFTREEWQQAKRGGHDPKLLKEMFRDCWAISDSKAAFAQALKARGYTLARGDRRGYVAVDFRGEVYAIAKWTDLKTKDVRARLGDGQDLPSVEQAKEEHRDRMTAMLREHIARASAALKKQEAVLAFQRSQIVARQRQERAALEERQQKRGVKETADRAARLSRGVRGLWDRITGKHQRTAKQNELEAWQSVQRDRREKDDLISRHLDERHGFHERVRMFRQEHAHEVAELHRDIACLTRDGTEQGVQLRERFQEAARVERDATQVREHPRDFGPER